MKIYEGNAINPIEDYQGKWALSPCGNVVATDFNGKEGWFIVEPFDQTYSKYVNGVLVEDKLKEFQDSIQYQHDAFNEYSRQIIYQINYNRALGNTTLVTSLNNQLKAEQQAVITRINVITEAYNANNQQST
jgi:hypothetical protein